MAIRKVCVAMIGGVDSAGAALLLRQQGYEVFGVTLRLRSAGASDPQEQDIADARSVADTLGISHTVLDLRELFQREVMDHFVSEYVAGRTPNPCVDCNRCIKFGALLDWALDHGADALATGHYARVGRDEASGRHLLLRGTDRRKDQSYVLYQLTQHQLSHLLLPVGSCEKPQLRAMAEQAGLRNAHRADSSRDICFIPDGDYVAFLRSYGGVALRPRRLCGSGGPGTGAVIRGWSATPPASARAWASVPVCRVYVVRKDLETGHRGSGTQQRPLHPGTDRRPGKPHLRGPSGRSAAGYRQNPLHPAGGGSHGGAAA